MRLTELTQDGQTHFMELVFLLNAATRDGDDYTDERLWQLAGVDLHEFAHESDGVHPLHFVVDVDVQRPAAGRHNPINTTINPVWYSSLFTYLAIK